MFSGGSWPGWPCGRPPNCSSSGGSNCSTSRPPWCPPWCPPGCCSSNCCSSTGNAPGNNGCPPDASNCPCNPWLDCSAVFGGMFRSNELMLDLTAGSVGTILTMDAPFPLQNVGFNGNSTLNIQCSGTYELTFFGNFTFDADSRLTFYVNANGQTLTETVVVKDVAANVQDSFERTVILRLCAQTNLVAAVDNAAAADGGATGRLTIPANGVHLWVTRIGP